MKKNKLCLLLADDDSDDCEFFKDALAGISESVNLITVSDGVQLMNFLVSKDLETYPDIIFLDLNMPRKSGLECITEIKAHIELKHIPIIIYSTSLDIDVVNKLYEMGAHFYVQKPGNFAGLKKVIKDAITPFKTNNMEKPSREKFVIQP
jgi:response regulator RpfG family c-di-GMP phosphodiesterase